MSEKDRSKQDTGELVRSRKDLDTIKARMLSEMGSTSMVHDPSGTAQRDRIEGALRGMAASAFQAAVGQGHILEEQRISNEITSDGFAEVGQGLEGVREIIEDGHGPKLPQGSMEDSIRKNGNFDQAVSAYQQGLLNGHAAREVENLINSRVGSPEAATRMRTHIESTVRDAGLKDAGLSALNILETPASLFGANRSMGARQVQVLREIAQEHPNAELNMIIRQADSMMNLAQGASSRPVSNELMIDLTNNGLLTEPMQHHIKRRFREARLAGSRVDANYNLMELLDQGDYARKQREEANLYLQRLDEGQDVMIEQGAATNRKLDRRIEQGDVGIAQRDTQIKIAGANLAANVRQVGLLEDIKVYGREAVKGLQTLASQGDQLIRESAGIRRGVERIDRSIGIMTDELMEANAHLGNIEATVGRLVDVTYDGFMAVRSELREGFAANSRATMEVAMQVALSRVATESRLISLEDTAFQQGEAIQAGIRTTHREVAKVVKLMETSLSVESSQRFREGIRILKGARTEQDYRYAKDAFMAGIERDRSNVFNQVFMAIASEKLGETDDAKEGYRMAGQYSDRQHDDMASKSYVRLAAIEQEEGEMPSSIEHLKNALERDPDNKDAKWLLARSLAMAGMPEESQELLMEFFKEDPLYIVEFSHDNAFDEIARNEVYKQLWDLGIIRRPLVLVFLITELINRGEKEKAFEIVKFFILHNPKELIENRLVFMPEIEDIKEVISVYLSELSKEADRRGLSAKKWYAIALIMMHLGVNQEDIEMALENGLEKDPGYKRGDKKKVRLALMKIDRDHARDFIGIFKSKLNN